MIDFTKEIKQKGPWAPNLISGALLPTVHYSMRSLQFAKEGLGGFGLRGQRGFRGGLFTLNRHQILWPRGFFLRSLQNRGLGHNG
jgi:hypothetical protein